MNYKDLIKNATAVTSVTLMTVFDKVEDYQANEMLLAFYDAGNYWVIDLANYRRKNTLDDTMCLLVHACLCNRGWLTGNRSSDRVSYEEYKQLSSIPAIRDNLYVSQKCSRYCDPALIVADIPKGLERSAFEDSLKEITRAYDDRFYGTSASFREFDEWRKSL